MIPTFSLNSSRAPTELCILGAKCETDKSPFNTTGHRHPYTPFYSMLMATYKNKPVRFAEIGVAVGSSVAMWCQYFEKGQLYFFDRDHTFLKHAASFGFAHAEFALMDVSDPQSIHDSLERTGGELDILLDDSSHDIWHQKEIIREALPFLKPGGILLIEDVFRNLSDEEYMRVIEPVKDQLSFYAFFEMEHVNKWSPGWDNDKILMLVKK
jgi:predicted O-methyltransferase YrrM